MVWFQVLAGDDTGLLKEIIVPSIDEQSLPKPGKFNIEEDDLQVFKNKYSKEKISSTTNAEIKVIGKQDLGCTVSGMNWMDNDKDVVFATPGGEILWKKGVFEVNSSNDVVRVFRRMKTGEIQKKNKTLNSAVVEFIGLEKLCTKNNEYIRAMNNGSVEIFRLYGTKNSMSGTSNSWFQIPLTSDQVMCKIRSSRTSKEFGFGGKNITLSIWDVESESIKLKFKNVKNDKLGLEVPIWISDIDYLSEDSTFVTGTGYHKVRLYDSRASQRPIVDVKPSENKVTRVLSSGCGQFAYMADAVGSVLKLDVRKNLLTVGKYAGNKGSVRDIALSKDGKYVGTVGLDRYLRVFEEKSRKLMSKVYLKQKQNCVLFGEYAKAKESAIREENGRTIEDQASIHAEEKEVDALWNEIDEVVSDEDEEGSEEEEEEVSTEMYLNMIEKLSKKRQNEFVSEETRPCKK